MALLEHRDDDGRPRTAERRRIAGIRLVRVVGAVGRLACPQDAVVQRARLRAKRSALPLEFGQCGRRADTGDRMQQLTIVAKQCTEFCITNTDGVREHGAEDRLELARGARDRLQHLEGRALLLARLLQLLTGVAQVAFELGDGGTAARRTAGCRWPRWS